jgi:hypothetical protein
MADIEFERGAATPALVFTVTNSDGSAADVSAATFTFIAREGYGGKAFITKNDADFNKGQAADGIISCPISSTDTAYPGDYLAGLKIDIGVTNVDKQTFSFKVKESITD